MQTLLGLKEQFSTGSDNSYISHELGEHLSYSPPPLLEWSIAIQWWNVALSDGAYPRPKGLALRLSCI